MNVRQWILCYGHTKRCLTVSAMHRPSERNRYSYHHVVDTLFIKTFPFVMNDIKFVQKGLPICAKALAKADCLFKVSMHCIIVMAAYMHA